MVYSASKWLLKVAFVPALALAMGAAGCGRGPTGPTDSQRPTAAVPGVAAPESGRPSVSIDNFSFNPPTITVAAGTTVVWVNRDDVPHTVTASDKGFASKALDTDDRFSHLFTTPGTYGYYCAVHTHMTGQVIVK